MASNVNSCNGKFANHHGSTFGKIGTLRQKWWQRIDQGVVSLNSLPTLINKKRLNRTLADHFFKNLYQIVPIYYIAQFEIAPQLVKFHFSVMVVVRPKLLAQIGCRE